MGTRRVHVGCEFTFVAEIATPTVFQVEPSTDERVDIADAAWRTTPQLNTRTYSDVYGNPCTRLILPPGTSTVGYSALATVPAEAEPVDESAPEIAAEDLPDEVLLYTLPSRYCLPDVLGDHAWAQFGSLPRGYTRVQAVVDYVNHYLRFEYGTSLATSSAVDVFQSGVGVCRDFAHLAISFCRALSIPARYVFGYIPEMEVEPSGTPMDFAAWMEVWLGDRWWTFDPRNNRPRKGRVLIGRGRDASDVAMATTFGGPQLVSMTVVAEEVAP